MSPKDDSDIINLNLPINGDNIYSNFANYARLYVKICYANPIHPEISDHYEFTVRARGRYGLAAASFMADTRHAVYDVCLLAGAYRYGCNR